MPRRAKPLPDPDEEPLPAAEPEPPDEPDYVSDQPGGPGVGWVTLLGDGGRMP